MLAGVVDAHVSNSSTILAGGSISVQAIDTPTLISAAGALAVAGQEKGVGVSISYNRISDSVSAVVSGSTLTASTGSVNVLAKSTSLLVGIGAAGAGSTNSVGGAGGLTINSIANAVDAHIARTRPLRPRRKM